MKRLQIMIDEDLDADLERLAAERGTSKAALIREFVRERVRPLPPLSADPLMRMAGAADFEPAPVDDIVYQ
jgi:Ribbon-helix-helix protein, copG family